MAIGKYSLMFVLMILTGIVYKTTGLSCHPYTKHAAIREGLLSNLAICRAKHIDFNKFICLNGKKPDWVYCSTGGCNVFGYNCNGDCLSGKDFIPGETDIGLECDISSEIRNLCNFYFNYDPTAVFYMSKLENLCPNLKSDYKKLIDQEWIYYSYFYNYYS